MSQVLFKAEITLPNGDDAYTICTDAKGAISLLQEQFPKLSPDYPVYVYRFVADTEPAITTLDGTGHLNRD